MFKSFEEAVSVKVIGLTQPVVDYINDSEGIVSYAARVSNPANQTNFDTAAGLLRYCAREGHWSVFEMANAIIEIKAPRDISRQILRHASARFQEFCVAEGTKIYTYTKKGTGKRIKIEDLYKRQQSPQYWNMADNLVKVFNEETGLLEYAKIKEVFNTGVKPVYEMTLENGKKITSTKDHKFLTFEGFKKLEDISKGDMVGCNGAPVHQDYNWLKKAKEESLSRGGLQYIADKADVSYHTIRKWLKRNGLSYTKKEVALYTEAWNKGLPTEDQPNYGKTYCEVVRGKMRISARKGKESNLYLNGNKSYDTISFSDKSRQFSYSYKNKLLKEQGYKCAISGDPITEDSCEVDHIEPVFKRPDLAFDEGNLQAISIEQHRIKTKKESNERKTTARYSPVKEIKYVGEVQTYDIEVDHVSHNYVAEGIITHNSQRYAAVGEDMFVFREARYQDTTNRQNSIELDGRDEDQELGYWWIQQQIKVLEVVQKAYKEALVRGIAKECARVVLPEGLTMSSMYMNATLRTWIHYANLREGNGTQKEHIIVAKKVKRELEGIFPNIMSLYKSE